MGRNWRPKYRAYCLDCDWSGIRAHVSRPCPKCGGFHVVKQYPNQPDIGEVRPRKDGRPIA